MGSSFFIMYIIDEATCASNNVSWLFYSSPFSSSRVLQIGDEMVLMCVVELPRLTPT